jgi:uncharacterized membrane protein (DUF2068 family)
MKHLLSRMSVMKSYLVVSGCLFALVAAMHLVRLINQMPAELGAWSVPLWASWFGLIIAGSMSGWAFRLAFPPRRVARRTA